MSESPVSAKEALASYHALPPATRLALDYWLEHALRRTECLHEVNKRTYESDGGPYVSNSEFNGALLAHGFVPRKNHGSLGLPAQFRAIEANPHRYHPWRLYREGEPPAWYAEFTRLANAEA